MGALLHRSVWLDLVHGAAHTTRLAGYQIDVRAEYSGREMYGSTCVAVVASVGAYSRFVAAMLEQVRPATQEDGSPALDKLADAVENILRRVKTDEMGKSLVHYWPTLSREPSDSDYANKYDEPDQGFLLRFSRQPDEEEEPDGCAQCGVDHRGGCSSDPVISNDAYD